MTGKILASAAKMAAVIFATTIVLAVTVATAGATVLYNNIPLKPAALPAEGFECCQVAQFGGAVEFSQEARQKNDITFTVTVGMDSYACEFGSWLGKPECVTPTAGAKFKWPVTLRINDLGPGNAVGELIAEETKEFEMPYRLSQNNTYCTGKEAGAWYDRKTHECYIDNFFTISYRVKVPKIQRRAIISVAYNTSDYGEHPQRPQPCNEATIEHSTETYDDCPYDSLNVAVNSIYKEVGPGEYEAQPTAPSTGTDPLPEEVFANSRYSLVYCEKTTEPPLGQFGATGVYESGPKAGKGCWTYEQPAIKVVRN